MPLVFALLQNRKRAEGRWAGPGLVGGAGPGRVSMRSARRLCACGGSLWGPRDTPQGSNRRNSSRTLGVTENREPTECLEEGTGVGTGAASVSSGAV